MQFPFRETKRLRRKSLKKLIAHEAMRLRCKVFIGKDLKK